MNHSSPPDPTMYPRNIQHHDRWDEYHDDEIVDWKRVRALIEHENQLINHRITWLLALQAALVTLTGSNLVSLLKEGRAEDVFSIMPVALIGFLVSLFITLALSQAERLIHETVEWWHDTRLAGSRPSSDKYHPSLFPSLDWVSHSHKYAVLGLLFTIFWGTLFWGGLALLEMQRSVDGPLLVRTAGFLMLLVYGLYIFQGLRKASTLRRGKVLSRAWGTLLLVLIVLGMVAVSPWNTPPKCNIFPGIYSCKPKWLRNSMSL